MPPSLNELLQHAKTTNDVLPLYTALKGFVAAGGTAIAYTSQNRHEIRTVGTLFGIGDAQDWVYYSCVRGADFTPGGFRLLKVVKFELQEQES